MKRLYLLLAVALTVSLAPALAPAQSGESNLTALNNKDIVQMVEHNVEAEAIIKTIKLSPCTFDTFPPVLKELKRRGVPEKVLQAMVDAPYGPAMASNNIDELGEQPIYHYAEHLRQMGVLTPIASGRRVPTRQPRTRAARTRPRPGGYR